MSESNWNAKGAALSDKSAREEFGLTQEEIHDAIRDGTLQYRQNHIHGNPYLRLLRKEVEALVTELRGSGGSRGPEVTHRIEIGRDSDSQLQVETQESGKAKSQVINRPGKDANDHLIEFSTLKRFAKDLENIDSMSGDPDVKLVESLLQGFLVITHE